MKSHFYFKIMFARTSGKCEVEIGTPWSMDHKMKCLVRYNRKSFYTLSLQKSSNYTQLFHKRFHCEPMVNRLQLGLKLDHRRQLNTILIWEVSWIYVHSEGY